MDEVDLRHDGQVIDVRVAAVGHLLAVFQRFRIHLRAGAQTEQHARQLGRFLGGIQAGGQGFVVALLRGLHVAQLGVGKALEIEDGLLVEGREARLGLGVVEILDGVCHWLAWSAFCAAIISLAMTRLICCFSAATAPPDIAAAHTTASIRHSAAFRAQSLV